MRLLSDDTIIETTISAWEVAAYHFPAASRIPNSAVRSNRCFRSGSDAMLGEHLDGDRAVQAGVARLVHFAHAPSPNGREDLVVPEAGADFEWHGLFGRTGSFYVQRGQQVHGIAHERRTDALSAGLSTGGGSHREKRSCRR